MIKKFYDLNARDTKKVLDNCFIVARDRFINVLVDDVCSEIKYFISNEMKIMNNMRLNKDSVVKTTLCYFDDIQSAFSNLSEAKMKHIKKGYLCFFRQYTVCLSKKNLMIIEDFVYTLLDTLYHYFYQGLMRKYENEIRIQYKKAYSLLSLSLFSTEDGTLIKEVEGLINDEVMKNRVVICGKQLSYRKGNEKYLFFRFLIMQKIAEREQTAQRRALKGIARKILGSDKYVISKIKTIPSHWVKLSKHNFRDII